ncbi:MAG: efflux RND transporter periplasmic adaptor subunit [Chitinivibrionales bacterium]|nr:efflux RND transporter periplasmic adaptor subunit [Chitinivibrionales bacterium]
MKNKFIIIALSIIIILLCGIIFLLLFKPNVPKIASKPELTQTISASQLIYHCPMHPTYLSDKPGTCPICGMNLVPVNQDQHQSDGSALNLPSDQSGPGDNRIKIDPTTIQNMGVTVEKAAIRTLTKEIRTSGTVDMSETSVSIVNTKIMGWVEKLYVDYTGQQVVKGQPLLSLYSPELVSTQEEFLAAIRYAQQLSQSSKTVQDGGHNLVESAKRRLLNWDIPQDEIDSLAKRGTPRRTMTIYAPKSGIVLEKMVVSGQNVMPGMALYKIADLSTVWVIATVYQDDLPFIKTGMNATIELSSLAGKPLTGKVQFIAPVLDMTSKTAQVRIEISNTPDFRLKPQMFATVRIQSPASFSTVTVAEQAVIHSGTRDIVIISLGNGYFKPIDVKLGIAANGYVQVLKGIHSGDEIVTSSQFLIDSESNLRAAVDKLSAAEPQSAPSQVPTPQTHETTPVRPSQSSSNTHAKAKTKTATETSDNQKLIIYTCPMHPSIVSDKPGRCPICNMFLVEKSVTTTNVQSVKEKSASNPLPPVQNKRAVVVDKQAQQPIYYCPMDQQITSDKPGSCPICGMDLVLKLDSLKTGSTETPGNTVDATALKQRFLPVVENTIYYCPMDPEIVSREPGDCPKCGMYLIPKKIDTLSHSDMTVDTTDSKQH